MKQHVQVKAANFLSNSCITPLGLPRLYPQSAFSKNLIYTHHDCKQKNVSRCTRFKIKYPSKTVLDLRWPTFSLAIQDIQTLGSCLGWWVATLGKVGNQSCWDYRMCKLCEMKLWINKFQWTFSMYVYVCVYIYIYMYTCICTFTYVQMYMCICICVYVHVHMYSVHVHMYMCICICVYVYVYVYRYICVNVHVCTYVRMYV